MGICYYKILGVSSRASQDEIKRAFRMLALRWHPDRNPHDPIAAERFREALDAYENLVDPSRRGEYDQVRRRQGARAKTRHRERPPGAQRASAYTVEEILSELFGFDPHHARPQRRNDLRFDLQIPRSAALGGTHEEIVFQRMVFCRTCLGNGRKTAASNCRQCHGRGTLEELCTLRVWVPAGSQQGTRLRIMGEGDRLSPQVAAADLIVYVHLVEGR